MKRCDVFWANSYFAFTKTVRSPTLPAGTSLVAKREKKIIPRQMPFCVLLAVLVQAGNDMTRSLLATIDSFSKMVETSVDSNIIEIHDYFNERRSH
jgi:hypothetical protein